MDPVVGSLNNEPEVLKFLLPESTVLDCLRSKVHVLKHCHGPSKLLNFPAEQYLAIADDS